MVRPAALSDGDLTQPGGLPDRGRTLAGDRVLLEPLSVARHADALFAAGHDDRDPALWDFMPYGPFDGDRAGFDAHLAAQEASSDPLFYAVVDHATGRAAGVVSLLRMRPAHRVIEIGHIWFGAALQRTPHATEAILLLATHAFDDLRVRRLEWKCNAANERSRRAAERFGFTYEGTFRQHRIVKGKNRDTAWFSLLDGEWPARRAAYRRWLSPENFDAEGRQRTALGGGD